jgi:serine/threonine-protein kinase
MPNEWAERVAELVKSALEREPESWPEFLDQECGSDAAMRAEIESLLKQQEHASRFIETPALHLAAESLVREGAFHAGQTIGDYEILSLIGTGGMGEVYLAHDRHLNRKAALKFVRRGMDSDDILRRFQHEERLLASLNHPNIAQLYGSGVTADGIPFFAMEYVEGERLDEYCNERRLATEKRLQLFRKVCSAVTYAHQHLVIHRDIKPANIRVTAEGEPKLLDFGIAKLLDSESAQSSGQTLTLQGVMTPEYASPEQIAGGSMTTASDVYSLGVVLYELLSGHRPYRVKSRRADEIARAITEQEPTRPSTAVGDATFQLAGKRSLRGDLDNIVLMAMRKEPARRYASVAQFSEDIRRHLEGLPVIARKDTWSYRSGKFVRRHKVGALAATLVLLALVAGIIAFAIEARVADAQRDQARIEKANAERVSAFLQNVLLLADPSWINTSSTRGHELTANRLLEIAASRAQKELADQPAVLAGVLRSIGNTHRAQGNYDEAERTLQEARDILIRARGAQDYDAMNVSYNLAQCLMMAGKYAEAEPLYRAAVPFFRERVNRADNAQLTLLAGILNDFGLLLRFEGHPDAAEARLLEAMQFAPRWQGASRALVGIHESVLGLARDDQGDLAGAEKYEREAVAELRRLPGGDRVELGGALLYLGHVLTTKGDYANAETAIREGLSIYHRLLGDAHPYVATGLDRLARLQFLQGDPDKAKQSAEQAIAIQNAKLPAEHPQRAYPLTTLGIVFTYSGRAPEAEPHLQRALSLREKILPQNHWLVAETKLALGESLSAQNKPAESMLIAGYEGLKTSLGPAHPRTLAAAQILAKLYEASGRPELANKYRASSLLP